MKDPRYETIRQKIKSGEIWRLGQIFDIIPVREVAEGIWLQQNLGHTTVPDTEEVKQEIDATVRMLENPVPSPELLYLFQGMEKYN